MRFAAESWYSIKFSLTALVELVDAGDVIGAHHLGGADDAVRVVLCNDGGLAVDGEGVSGSRHRRAVENNLAVQAQTLCGSWRIEPRSKRCCLLVVHRNTAPCFSPTCRNAWLSHSRKEFSSCWSAPSESSSLVLHRRREQEWTVVSEWQRF